MPIIHGKPFGVYTGYEEATPYGHNLKGGRPDYDIVEGVPSTYYGSKKLPFNDKGQPEGQASTPRPYEHNDAIDMKPPAIIPHFVPEVDKPGRPYTRQPTVNKIESRPALHARPEILSHSHETRPHQVKQPNEVKPGMFIPFGNHSMPYETKVNNQSHLQLGGFMDLNWTGGIKAPSQRPDESRPVGHEVQPNNGEIIKTHFRNGTMPQKTDGQFPQANTQSIKPGFQKNRLKVVPHSEYGARNGDSLRIYSHYYQTQTPSASARTNNHLDCQFEARYSTKYKILLAC